MVEKKTKKKAKAPGKQPLFKKETIGLVSATGWANENVDEEGKTFVTESVQLQRRYKNSEGEWKSTNVLRINDIPKAIHVLQEAYKELVTYKRPATVEAEATE